MNIIEFIEQIYGIKLLEHQKRFVEMCSKTRKELGGDFQIIMGRKSNIYIIKRKENKNDKI